MLKTVKDIMTILEVNGDEPFGKIKRFYFNDQVEDIEAYAVNYISGDKKMTGFFVVDPLNSEITLEHVEEKNDDILDAIRKFIKLYCSRYNIYTYDGAKEDDEYLREEEKFYGNGDYQY